MQKGCDKTLLHFIVRFNERALAVENVRAIHKRIVLTTEAIVGDAPEDKPAMPQMPAGGMGGMGGMM